MATKLKIKKGDQVIVLRGKDKGKKGEVPAGHPQGNACRCPGCERHSASPRGRPRRSPAGSSSARRRFIFPTWHASIPRRGRRRGSGTSSSMMAARVRFAKRSGEVIDS